MQAVVIEFEDGTEAVFFGPAQETDKAMTAVGFSDLQEISWFTLDQFERLYSLASTTRH